MRVLSSAGLSPHSGATAAANTGRFLCLGVRFGKVEGRRSRVPLLWPSCARPSSRGSWEYGVSVGLDGTAVRFGNWGSGASGGTGIARLDDDRLCFVLTSTSACGFIFRNPGGTRTNENEYLWFSGGWVMPFSQVE